ncbi:Translational regulator CsrA (plasmid) [Xanthomonas hydrangeae]|uniref:carbon storage regulator n=1 Tax=Xanthomonas hydrangeae TaxID=2775159 RepID=UPI001962CE55|nr:Translational regulator CsrA [Xanthomonas hydrangeae]CAD7741119.1 Translational regulator CsrA [Xanthomonas hydrangeae]CAD7747960.1 Translational regulator CsrA [Xanthomonas hydrangeae]CAD7747961.1 Translational regulator CsrA [Xanthomonas hydrangeae]CAD7748162.1 Translational regulator CsrA [Xanthomonas hydrangeae]
MLMLTRKIGQTIMVGDDVAVVVKGIDQNGQVMLGIVAPRETLILRRELYAGDSLPSRAQGACV